MHIDEKLDLSGIVVPFCLFMCKTTLAAMKPGAIVEIRLRDPAIIEDLLIILQRSGDRVMSQRQEGEHYHLWVQKKPGR